MNDQDVTAVLERVIGPLEDEMGSWDDVLRRAAEARPEGWDDVLYPAGAEHQPRRRTFPRWRIVAVAAAILVGGLLVTPASASAISLLDSHRAAGTATSGPTVQSPVLVARRTEDRVRGPPTRRMASSEYVMNADGSGQSERCPQRATRLLPGRPTGRIAFSRHDGQVYVMNADGSGQRKLTRRPARTRLRPGRPTGGGSPSSAIARRRRRLRDERRRKRAAEADAQRGHAPAWSPDGRKIAFRARADGNGEVYVMNADGSGQRRLTRADGPAVGSSCLVARRAEDRLRRRTTTATGDLRHERRRERAAEPDAQPARRRAPAWSPDGRKIAFVSGRDGNGELYVMNADGSGLRNLTRNPGELGLVAGPRRAEDRLRQRPRRHSRSTS